MAQINLTLDQAIYRVRARVGDIAGSYGATSDADVHFGDERLTAFLNDGCKFIQMQGSFKALRLLHKTEKSSLVPGSGFALFAVPDDFARLRAVYIDGAPAIPFSEDGDAARKTSSLIAASGRQPAYRIDKDSVFVLPPSASQYEMRYIREHREWVKTVTDPEKQTAFPEFDEVWREALLTYAVGRALAGEAGAATRLEIIQYADAQLFTFVQQANLAFGATKDEDFAAAALDAIGRVAGRITINAFKS